ncbi:MAG: hypothetical protein A4E36_00058 [Methanoregulaceae archaeon PtaB.Bin009]|nr:MAG: hypothetical protein A4E36_00058 [Methanoregulaceae archaeon PtaB.Bin009]OPY40354.1 MAG: hypothetical protein A4E41_01429 [Methanoregulaceae archaeon PtaU1.Bin066]
MSALGNAAAISAGSCVSTESGPSISSRAEKAERTWSNVASNPNPRSTISAPREKRASTLARRSGTRCASMISARTFMREPPPIFTPLTE